LSAKKPGIGQYIEFLDELCGYPEAGQTHGTIPEVKFPQKGSKKG
jgi:hypothetical protein